MKRITASSLQRYMECPASAVLPAYSHHNDGASVGTLLHEWVEGYLNGAPPVPSPEIEQWARSPYLLAALDEILEMGAPNTEVKFAGNPMAGEAQALQTLGQRDYSEAPQDWICGTADIVIRHPDSVTVIDLKTGYTDPPPANRNWQLKFLAWAASRAYGVTEASIGILRVWSGGDSAALLPLVKLHELDLDLIQDALANLQADLSEAEHAPDAYLSTGPQCRFCDSLPFCPAVKAEVSALGEEVDLSTDDGAAEAWRRLETVEAIAKRARQALERRAVFKPIPLGDGRVVAEVDKEGRESIDGAVAIPILRELGIQPPVSLSKTAIKKAAKKNYDAVMARLAKAGAIKPGRKYKKVEVVDG